ncbi:SlyX family protein [Azospirillum thermophilum]|uniref:Protein SlyX homolog n=1 Tax=Azospirillum thermophilum TaxID=2202148 RepID=A0A2S2CWV3_9PROT|nr:SlyX family protein [Azospirillum thermophilum]AWK89003.1 SlyX protein [Azospirillum thermophilum]
MADTPDPSTDQRLTDLEIRLAHHEKMAEEMSQVLFEQGRTIDRMAQQIKRLRDRLLELESSAARAPIDEPPPPHY